MPKRIRMIETVRAETPFSMNSPAYSGQEYDVCTNSHGAVSVRHPDNQMLGVKPDEYEVIDWFTPEVR